MRRTMSFVIVGVLLAAPLVALAFPFGGQASFVSPCYNSTIFARLGGPIGGDYVWVPTTKTYQFGPPTHAGQWLLGLASVPYFCLLSPSPVIIIPAIAIDMMGSSGPAGAAYTPPPSQGSVGNLGSSVGTPSPSLSLPGSFGGGGVNPGVTTGGGSPGSSGTLQHVLVSEVYPLADSSHGGGAAFGWIELFNGTGSGVDVSGWNVQTASTTISLPSGTVIASNQYLLIAGTSTIRTMWNISSSVSIIVAPPLFNPGLSPSGDLVSLQNSSGVIDAVSWGTNASAFTPSAIAPLGGYSLIRTSLSSDTNSSSDWTITSQPLPGR